ncbi:hypothetical protein HYY69_01215 [Candidatus Woesearchaeota archaeon]|nr:hypothetical protein [Candidatus Woesearchaeota archaeon]
MAEDITSLLEKIGYAYFKVEKTIVIEEIIIKILSIKEKRFIKAIPFIIYLSTKESSLHLDLDILIKKAKEKNLWKELKAILSLTAQILKQIESDNILIPKLEKIENKTVKRFIFSFEEYKDDFIGQKKRYETEQQIGLAQKISNAKEYDIQYALHILFKPKQIEIIKKIIEGVLLTKIEYDYYFKTIKKRLRAIKLIGDFADTVIQKKVSKVDK